MRAVPLQVFEAAVQVAGEALYWKSSLRQLLRSSGVSENACIKYEQFSKFMIFRSVWADLDSAGDRGRRVQHNLITHLANLDKPQAKADIERGTTAIAELRRLAQQAELLVSPEEQRATERRQAAALMRQEKDGRRGRLADLKQRFVFLHQESDLQRRGYAFEKLLRDLFLLYELHYEGSYKTSTDQIDGHLLFESFSYLVEARWRKSVAVDEDLGALSWKVERRLDGTRGLFVSMAGFRPEVVDLFRRARESRLVLMDGEDLAVILDGRIELPDALHEKILAASREGEPHVRLAGLSR